MKFTILGFSQVKLMEYKLSIIDAHILRWFIDFYQTGKMVKITDEKTGLTFCWVKYDAVLDDLPLLGITNARVIARRFDAMCECGLMRRIVKKTAQGTYSCFCLDPDKLNELLSTPKSESVPTSLKSNMGTELSSEDRPTSLKSDVGRQNGVKQEASALKSTVALKTEGEAVATSLKSDMAQTERYCDLPTSLKSDVGTEIPSKKRAMSPKSDVAKSLKSDLLLVNSSTTLHPSTKKNPSASAVRTTLFELDKTFVLDEEFYPAAADFLHVHGLGEDYLRWFYQHLSSTKHIQNLPGYFFKVFFKPVYVERYKAWHEAHPDKQKGKCETTREYTCPVCGLVQEITAANRSCDRCEAPVNPTENEIARYTVFYHMDMATRERYISDRSQIFSSGGNVSEKMLILDRQYGIVS